MKLLGVRTSSWCHRVFPWYIWSERLREHHPYRLGGHAALRGRPLRRRSDPADLGTAGSGLEELRFVPGGAQRHPGHVFCFPPKSWAGQLVVSLCLLLRDGIKTFKMLTIRFWHGNEMKTLRLFMHSLNVSFATLEMRSNHGSKIKSDKLKSVASLNRWPFLTLLQNTRSLFASLCESVLFNLLWSRK